MNDFGQILGNSGVKDLLKNTGTSNELVDGKQLCEAIGCEEATEQVTVSAGKYGTLILFVCKGCINKFSAELD
jgi:hypothetical protein